MRVQMIYLRYSPSRYGNVVIAHLLGLFAGFMVHKYWTYESDFHLINIKSSLLASGPHGHDENQLHLQIENGSDFGIGSHKEHDDNQEGHELYRKVRVLCWVMTNPENHMKKAQHVLATWGKRCNHFLFMSSKTDKHDLPGVVQLNVSEGRDHLWQKTVAAFSYIYNNYADSADWFLKADDDTYVIVENLRFLLKEYSPKEPIYFGCKFKPYVTQGYMSGGAGYVLSREALNRLETVGTKNVSECTPRKNAAEDVEFGRCMEVLNVTAGDSRDNFGRGRFFPMNPETHLIPGYLGKDHWFWNWTYYDTVTGMEACSDSAISFHYISPNEMYVMEYLIYHLKPYGTGAADDPADAIRASNSTN